MKYLLIYSSFMILFAAGELLHRKAKVPSEVTRKLLHITIGLLALWWTPYLSQYEFIGITVTFIPLLIISRSRLIFRSIHVQTRKTHGEIYYIGGLLLIALLAYTDASRFTTTTLILIFPDACAGVVTYALGKNKKTLIHSLIFMGVSLLLLQPAHPFLTAFVFAGILSIVELVSKRGLDNITVPAAYIVLTLL